MNWLIDPILQYQLLKWMSRRQNQTTRGVSKGCRHQQKLQLVNHTANSELRLPALISIRIVYYQVCELLAG